MSRFNPFPDGDHDPGRLVTEDERFADHVLADPSVTEVVGVGPADPNRAHGHRDVTGVRLRRPAIFGGHREIGMQDGGAHGVGNVRYGVIGCCVGHTRMLAY